MKWIDRVLVQLGFLPKFSEDDRINASTEDAARTHETAVSKLHEAAQDRKQSNEALRQSIHVAKKRTNSFADFELQVRRDRKHVRRSD
jgi:hypothetical protein